MELHARLAQLCKQRYRKRTVYGRARALPHAVAEHGDIAAAPVVKALVAVAAAVLAVRRAPCCARLHAELRPLTEGDLQFLFARL